MPLVGAAIMPHVFSLVEPIDSGDADTARLRAAIERIARDFAAAGVETVVVMGPHGTRVEGSMAMVNTGRVAGTVEREGTVVELQAPVDRNLVRVIYDSAVEAQIPVVLTGFGGNRPEQAVAPLDWGGFVPLWFLGHRDNRTGSGSVLTSAPDDEHGPACVLITPSRHLPLSIMRPFGRAIGKALAQSPTRIGIVSSSDWAHTHAEDGPYGAHPTARSVDDQVEAAVRGNDLKSLEFLPEQDVSSSAIDGLWQTLVLAGVQEVTPFSVVEVTYGIEHYVSMIAARYHLES